MAEVIPDLARQGVDVKIVSFSDYIQPNLALAAGEIDANLYQNVPFLEQFNRDHGTRIVSVVKAYLPPMALYPGRSKTLTDIPDGGIIAIPNDPVNSGRALLLLQSAKLISMQPRPNSNATVRDVTANPKHLRFSELEAAQLPRVLPDVNAAVINANYALDAKLDPTKNVLYRESAEGSPYANILAANAGRENDPRITAVAKALTSDKVRAFLNARYHGAVFPAF